MFPAGKIQNVEHAQLQRNTEMLNKTKKKKKITYDSSTVMVGDTAHLTREDKNECLPERP